MLFQKFFTKYLSDFFGITEQDFVDKVREKIQNKGVSLCPKLTNRIIVNAEIPDYDKLSLDSVIGGYDEEYEISRNDIERLFNYWCYKILTEQSDETAKISNVSRSWGPLKSALRVWFKSMLGIDTIDYYKVFLADINKEQNSVFRKTITYALKEYYPIRKEYIKNRKIKIEEKEKMKFDIKPEYRYTEDFHILSEDETTTKLSVVQPFYIRKEYKGKKNEIKFIKFLEGKNNLIDWWFKNGDNGKDYFCLKYTTIDNASEALFYPDWIIRFKSGVIGIFDTKAGFTATDTNGRAEGLYNKIESLKKNGVNCIGGLVVLENNQWYCSNNLPYNYAPGKLSENWKLLDELLETVEK